MEMILSEGIIIEPQPGIVVDVSRPALAVPAVNGLLPERDLASTFPDAYTHGGQGVRWAREAE